MPRRNRRWPTADCRNRQRIMLSDKIESNFCETQRSILMNVTYLNQLFQCEWNGNSLKKWNKTADNFENEQFPLKCPNSEFDSYWFVWLSFIVSILPCIFFCVCVCLQSINKIPSDLETLIVFICDCVYCIRWHWFWEIHSCFAIEMKLKTTSRLNGVMGAIWMAMINNSCVDRTNELIWIESNRIDTIFLCVNACAMAVNLTAKGD